MGRRHPEVVWHDVCLCETRLLQWRTCFNNMFDVTYSCAWHLEVAACDMTLRMQMWDGAHTYVWRDAFICDKPHACGWCIYIYIYVHVHMHIHMHSRTCIHLHIHVHTHIHINIHTHTCIYTYQSIYIFPHFFSIPFPLSLSLFPSFPLVFCPHTYHPPSPSRNETVTPWR